MTLLLLLAGLTRAEDVAVTSNLTGAAILLNGVDTGEVTPATLTGVPPGPIVVSVREGCASGSANVKVVAGQPAKVSLFAIEQGGTLVVKPTPADAIVSVNGKNLKSPGQKLTLDCGEHTVRAEREGYAVTVMTIQVTADDALVLPIELTKADLASLELSVQPRTALLMLDGKEVGTDTVTLPSVKPGTHTIAAEYTGYQSIEQTVSIASGDDVAWHFELVRTATKAKSTATQIRGKKPEATVADLDTDSGDDESLEDADEDTTDDVPYYARDPEAEKAAKAKADADADADADAKAKADADAKAKADADAKAKKAAEEEARREAEAARSQGEDDEDESLDELEPDVPYYLADDKKKEKEKATKSTSSGGGKVDSDDSGKPNKTGLRVAGGVTTGLGVLGGVGTVFLFDQANIAHDAWATKDAAAKASGDQELKKKATDYYNDVFTPKATMFYAAGGATAALLGTGVILFIVDAPMSPVVVPGGAMLTWHGSF